MLYKYLGEGDVIKDGDQAHCGKKKPEPVQYYRLLNIDEEIKSGDEVFNPYRGIWQLWSLLLWSQNDSVIIRRKIKKFEE